VCSDEDYAKEMAYLKEKVDAGGEVRAHRHPMCLCAHSTTYHSEAAVDA
jgi:hypothetical protein